MDRQGLKEGQEVYVKGRVIHTGDHLDIVLDKGSFIENAIILHHKKPVISQFVADWIEVCKDNLTHSLYTAMTPNFMKKMVKVSILFYGLKRRVIKKHSPELGLTAMMWSRRSGIGLK